MKTFNAKNDEALEVKLMDETGKCAENGFHMI